MRQSLNVLIVEDSERDAALLIRELQRAGYELSHERVDSEAAMTAAIDRRSWDIVLTDYSMPGFNAKAAVAVIAKSCIDIPCIVVSGSVGEETAVEVMRAGAQDLILKHNLKRLPVAIVREVEAARTRRERKAADAELDCERQLLRQLMKGIPDAICFKDTERRYTRLNDAARALLNVDNDADVIGKTVDGFIANELSRARKAEEEHILATGEPLVDCVEKLTGCDGAVRWLSATKAPIRNSQGKIVGIVEIARDITENKRQEQLKNEFIATVSHELRTPLTSIIGSVGFLAGGAAGNLSDPVARLLNIAHGNCQRLIRIVNDILDIEKLESGKINYDRRPVEVRELVDEVIEANQAFAAEYGVSVRRDGSQGQGVVMADPHRLAQVITNLLSNAIKFSPRNGEVIVAIENRDNLVGISVRDHGPGIPADYRDRIFEKFVQVEATDHRKKGGTGLGLSIVKQIVDQLGGTISFEPAPDGGAIFKVAFRGMENRSDPALPAVSSAGTGHRGDLLTERCSSPQHSILEAARDRVVPLSECASGG
jgi:two-component system, OmpR family, sensor histidine kinase VicK